MRRILVGFLGIAVCALVSLGSAGAADVLNADGTLPERALGKADAPVTIVEYASLTCPHCASFHQGTVPQLKSEYIDSGKVRLVYRDFPLDSLATAAAMLAHCSGPDRYFGFIEILFRSQQTWARSSNPRQDLQRLAGFANMTAAQFDACLKDADLLKAIQDRAREAQAKQGISTTPTIFVGDRKVSGSVPFDKLKEIVDAALAGN